MKYLLFYQAHMIAEIEEEREDFPTFFGRYRLQPISTIRGLSHISKYIDYSVRVWPLMEQDRFNEIEMVEEERFTDLIESSDWSLVEAQTQARIPILIPIFCTENGINWRLNPSL